MRSALGLLAVTLCGCAQPRAHRRAEPSPLAQLGPADSTVAPAPSSSSQCRPLELWPEGAVPLTSQPPANWIGMPPRPNALLQVDRFEGKRWEFAFQTNGKGVIHGRALDRSTGDWKTITLENGPRIIDGDVYATPTYKIVEDRVLVYYPTSTVVKGLLYDPVEDTWTPSLPAPGVDVNHLKMLETSHGLFAWSSSEVPEGFLFDAPTNHWARLPTADSPRCRMTELLPFGHEVLAFCHGTGPELGAWFDLETGRWRPLSTEGAPLKVIAQARLARVGGLLFAWNSIKREHQAGAVYDPEQQRWTPISSDPAHPLYGPYAVAGERVYWQRRQALRADQLPPRTGDDKLDFGRQQVIVTTYEPRSQRWAEVELGVDSVPVALEDGRLVSVSPYGDLVAVTDLGMAARCQYPLSAIPFMAGATLRTNWRSISPEGNRVRVWGRNQWSSCTGFDGAAACDDRVEEDRLDGVMLGP